ncbi:putative alginate lyase [Klebsiella pneumoniae]|nr:putative alginate lyase [Klebsiella pneumoniae]
MMSLWDALRMNMMISYQELVRTFPKALRRAHEDMENKNVNGKIVFSGF